MAQKRNLIAPHRTSLPEFTGSVDIISMQLTCRKKANKFFGVKDLSIAYESTSQHAIRLHPPAERGNGHLAWSKWFAPL